MIDTRRASESVKAARKKYKQLLESLPWDTPLNMTQEERQVYSLFKDIHESPLFKKEDAKNRIRTQPGHAFSFKVGLIRSGRYVDAIKQILAEYDLPEELAYLPMIESAFNPAAVSHAGAAGMWQFMRRTGKAYDLTINELVDERKDPILSTHAAAKLLKSNYKILKSWPLAITAYNHGVRGMRKAVKHVNSTDIGDILRGYDGRRFEFASRNFYAEFVAAADICRRYAEYFGKIEFDKPLKVARLKLPAYITVETLEKYSPLTASDIRDLNPALDPSVFEAGNFIPKDYGLNVLIQHRDILASSYESIPDALKHRYVPAKSKYRVRRGETLSEIARAHNTSVEAFKKLNGIRKSRKIRSGQRLKVPGKYVSLDVRSIPQPRTSLSENKPVKMFMKKHRVRRGQTLLRIAKFYNTSAKAIVKLNAIKNPQKIRAGQLLKIPDG
ncbi:LysM peptidoglycan-binding domain-containing protein [Desulfobacterales bacterium HSG2]|nr:LysM peptidoglycan-binding domain-containing protein [Desulfobacterales bacterium HSG2]